jgi:hypothetical protein
MEIFTSRIGLSFLVVVAFRTLELCYFMLLFASLDNFCKSSFHIERNKLCIIMVRIKRKIGRNKSSIICENH